MRWLKKFANNPLSVVGSTQISPATLRDLFYMKDIVWYEWLYAITEDGKVWSYPKYHHNGKFLSCGHHRFWYPMVTLTKNWKHKTELVHRLIAKTFIPNPENKPQVNHINSKPQDSFLENLEWCTISENWVHSYKFNNRIHPMTRWIAMYDKDWNLLKEFTSMTQASKETGNLLSAMSMSARWKQWLCWWYNWKYL